MSFQDLVNDSDTLKQRYADVSARVVSEVESRFGVTLSGGQIVELQAVKFAVLGGQPLDIDTLLLDVASIDAVAIAQEQADMREALTEQRVDTEQHDAAVQLLSSMKPEDRISFAREHNITGPKATPKTFNHTPEEKQALIAQAANLRGGARVAFARANGLL